MVKLPWYLAKVITHFKLHISQKIKFTVLYLPHYILYSIH